MNTPAILVHGYLASATLMRPMRYQLAKHGVSAHLTDLSLGAIQDVDLLATQLGYTVERVLRETGAAQVDLVGVSQGGIMALRYAARVNHTEQVRRIVTVGSPVRGTWVAAVGVPLLGAFSKGLWQLMPGSQLTEDLLKQSASLRAPITTISMRGDLVAPPSRCQLPGADNRVLRGIPSVVTHQLLVASPRTLAAVVAALA